MSREFQFSSDSPFHLGEQMIQHRMRVQDVMAGWGRKVIRDFMPDQHRAFYEQQPFVAAASLDSEKRPWASILFGNPGFIQSPNETSLEMDFRVAEGDSFLENFRDDQYLGLLGIEFATRRRNRVNGKGKIKGGKIYFQVDQSFGNCPKFIQARQWTKVDLEKRSTSVSEGDVFTEKIKQIMEDADTFFIASAFEGGDGHQRNGADISHRGGAPGFVQIQDDRTFLFPDYVGNNHYNTLGNALLNPHVGITFWDFASGDVVQMTGKLVIHWDKMDMPGAQRMIEFQLERYVYIEHAIPIRWEFVDYSPVLPPVEKQSYLDLVIRKIEIESVDTKSFYLESLAGRELPSFEPGQHLPVFVRLGGRVFERSYTLSDSPSKNYYRITVKKIEGEKPGIVSNFLHSLQVGDQIQSLKPRGDFFWQSKEQPTVLISAGVGITPMMSIAEEISQEEIWFFHGARNEEEHIFGDRLVELQDQNSNFHYNYYYSQPQQKDKLLSKGRISWQDIQTVLPHQDFQFYLCGPGGFMQTMYDAMIESGVNSESIHFESFGPSSVVRVKQDLPETAKVYFRKTNKEVTWKKSSQTILELAEENDVPVEYGCRTGSCGTCIVKVLKGKVGYLNSKIHGEKGKALLCSSFPKEDLVLDV